MAQIEQNYLGLFLAYITGFLSFSVVVILHAPIFFAETIFCVAIIAESLAFVAIVWIWISQKNFLLSNYQYQPQQKKSEPLQSSPKINQSPVPATQIQEEALSQIQTVPVGVADVKYFVIKGVVSADKQQIDFFIRPVNRYDSVGLCYAEKDLWCLWNKDENLTWTSITISQIKALAELRKKKEVFYQLEFVCLRQQCILSFEKGLTGCTCVHQTARRRTDPLPKGLFIDPLEQMPVFS